MTNGDSVGSGDGGGVRRGLGVAESSGVGVGVSDGLAVGVADGLAVAVGVADGSGVGVAVGAGVGLAVGAGVAVGEAVTTGDGSTDEELVGEAVADGATVSAGVGCVVTTGAVGGGAVGCCVGPSVTSGGFVTTGGKVTTTEVGAGAVGLPEFGPPMGTALRVVSVGATVGVATSVGTLPSPVCCGVGEMIAEAANTKAPPMSATATTVTIRVPVVRMAPRTICRGRLASHDRFSSRR